MENTRVSGVVIAGFGEEEIYPSLVSYKVEGIFEGVLKYKLDETAKVDFKTGAVIIPFAQKDMIHTFIEGVSPEYVLLEEKVISKILNDFSNIILDKILKTQSNKEKEVIKEKLNKINEIILSNLIEELKDYRNKFSIQPILNVVSMLPKDELAAMAESLINLTSLKRRWSLEQETVGGPIDVAVITKGDGFIWIKKKHYFKPELNPQFFIRYPFK